MSTPDPAATDKEVLDALAAFAAAQERDVITRALDAARDRLGMDAAYVSTITTAVQRVDEVSGDSRSLGFEAGMSVPLEQTYCARMLRGEIANIVPDTSADPVARELAASTVIGAYVGVPIRLADGRLHGTLCAASGAPQPNLGLDELRFMEVLAAIVAAEIDRSEVDRAKAAQRLLHQPN